ncbi:hypothetical protein AB0N65_17815, partial [Paenarthrobacter sp. NPDC089322]|uniref:hypothetical protein n=1 Tax=Paenarthrobacter sp. NPDC089322 TaxID=3155065 RepID=UPI003435BCAF
PPPEITAKAAANLKPAENQTTTHGGAQRPGKNSTNQKTIGINKLGTLLSSQTTGHNQHHPHPKPGPGSLRSNFSNLPAGVLRVKSASLT